MAEILSEEKIQTILRNYYKKNFGERDTDNWYVNPATNVWLFSRDGKLITLHCHPFNGEVKHKMRDLEQD